MEKLIELLNEYNKEIWKPKRMSGREVRTHYTVVISSWYWFIKWLVKNDKLDFRELPYLWEYWMWVDIPTDSIISTLSISDNPIEDLISYLK